MRKYINQIDDEVIKLKFTPAELAQYKSLTQQLAKLGSLVRELEKKACDKLQGVVIGDLPNIKFNYLAFGSTFYMSYVSDTPPKKWYQFWK